MTSLHCAPRPLTALVLLLALLLSCCQPVHTATTAPLPATVIHKYKGRLLGNAGANHGDRIAALQTLYQTADQPLPPTHRWTRGRRVVDTPSLTSGIVVATFKDATTYDGRAAVYERQNVTHVTIWEQDGAVTPARKFGPRFLPKFVRGQLGAADLYAVDIAEDREL